MLYLDTSVIVASLTNEAASKRAAEFLRTSSETEALVISDWSLTEVASAFSLKVRTHQLSESDRERISKIFESLVAETFEILPVTREHFHRGAQFASTPSLNLRSGDALHLAIAASNAATLYTLDRRMAEAGSALGIRAELL